MLHPRLTRREYTFNCLNPRTAAAVLHVCHRYATTSPPRPSRARTARSSTAASSAALEPRALFARGGVVGGGGGGGGAVGAFGRSLWPSDGDDASGLVSRQPGAIPVPRAPVKQRTYVDLTDPSADAYVFALLHFCPLCCLCDLQGLSLKSCACSRASTLCAV
jgi:hypothetical protein